MPESEEWTSETSPDDELGFYVERTRCFAQDAQHLIKTYRDRKARRKEELETDLAELLDDLDFVVQRVEAAMVNFGKQPRGALIVATTE